MTAVATYKVLGGDALEQLRTLPDASVQTCITSPPYWGLRNYGVDGQIGMEPTPEAYVERLVSVFREVRRVLRDDGTAWVVMGDSYANDAKWGGSTGGKHAKALHGQPVGRGKRQTGLKPKDLVGIPWRVAFALQADGWWLRSDVIEEVELYCPCGCGFSLEERIWRYAPDRDLIWAKNNAMPESVTDRPTRSHEYVFLLAKAERYYYDAEAIHEAPQGDGRKRGPKSVRTTTGVPGQSPHGGLQKQDKQRAQGRNKRDVWTVATRPYAGAHFATFPEALVEPMILAGCPVGGTVLDPFAGSGTTLAVANQLGRHAIGIELNPKYVALIHERCQQPSWIFEEGSR